MKCNHIMVCGHCLAHVQLPVAARQQGLVIDWFTSEHVGHLAQHENICVVDRLSWACANAAAYEPTDSTLRALDNR